MIIKPSTRRTDVAAVDAIIQTEEFSHLPDRKQRQLLAQRRGLVGEKSVGFIVDREFHTSNDHAVLHDLRIPDGIGSYAQIDHLILSRLSRTASILEVKNFSGRLSRNKHDEWMVWYAGRKQPQNIPNPLNQAKRQREVLRALLKANGHDKAFEDIGVFVIVPPECAIDRSKISSDLPIYKADNFYDAWLQFGGISPLGRLFSAGISSAMLRKVANQLLSAHEPAQLPGDHASGGAIADVEQPIDITADRLRVENRPIEF